MEKYKVNVQEIKDEAALIDKVQSELRAIKNVATFGATPRIGLVAFQGVGRLFAGVESKDCTEHVKNEAIAIILKYYNVIESIEKANQDTFLTYWFLYDCSEDGENEVYCE